MMNIRTILLTGAALAALSSPAMADDQAILQRLDAMQKMIEAQQTQIEAQKNEIAGLKKALGKPATKKVAIAQPVEAPAPLAEKIEAQTVRLDELASKFEMAQSAARIEKAEAPQWSFPGGRPTIQSSDGRFSLQLRLLGQFDAAYYMQDSRALQLAAANGPDLSSGTNFRRAQIGFQGKLFGDWSYLFNTEFGGSSGTETGGRVQSLYIQYDGLKPFTFRIGAYPPPGGLEDNTSSGDTIFLERAAASDIMRNAVGGDGRDAVTIGYSTDKLYAAFSYTGSKVGSAAEFDEQSALLARLSGVVYSDADTRVVLSASGAYLLRAPDGSAASLATRSVTLSSTPELTVDSTGTKLISTGAINTEHLTVWGAESGASWRSLYGQAGYFHYNLERRASALSDLNFSGWYAQATWVLTGESRGYNTSNAAFTSPKPRIPFSLEGGGWGAWELAARYSVVDLNDREGAIGLVMPVEGIRGGAQKIWTLGLNWYPNNALRFALDYEHIEVDRIGTIPALVGVHPALSNAQVGQTMNVIAMRSQLSL